MLDNQAQQVGDVAIGAAAVAQLLDTDELVRQERESLKQLQDGLREQLRKAEVDISLERAKLARERAELDEKLRGWESEKANLPSGKWRRREQGQEVRRPQMAHAPRPRRQRSAVVSVGNALCGVPQFSLPLPMPTRAHCA